MNMLFDLLEVQIFSLAPCSQTPSVCVLRILFKGPNKFARLHQVLYLANEILQPAATLRNEMYINRIS